MGNTTLTIDERTKERFTDNYRHSSHDSFDAALNAVLDVAPTIEDIEQGCTNPECDRQFHGSTQNEINTTIDVYHTETPHGTVQGLTLYCSPSCAKEVQDNAQAHVPSEPDLVVVGGVGETRAEFSGASFVLDGETMEVGIRVPGAFDGTDSDGLEYDYIVEPVYIKNEGMWVQEGVIENIIHEEAHTALILGHGDHAKRKRHHPSEEQREKFANRNE